MPSENTKPLSAAQIAANQRNAAKSTGPKTPEGKAASSRNALRHGLCAEKHVILDEDPEEFQALLDDLLLTFRPVGLSEEKLVNRMASVQWRLDRTLSLETGIYENHLAELKDDDLEVREQREQEIVDARAEGIELSPFCALYDPKNIMARAFASDNRSHHSMACLARYEASLERSFDRCIRQIKALQTARAAAAAQPPDEDRPPECETNPDSLSPDAGQPTAPPHPDAGPPVAPLAAVPSLPRCETNPSLPGKAWNGTPATPRPGAPGQPPSPKIFRS